MGNVEFDINLSNGMRIAALTNVADDSRTMLSNGLATQWMQPLRVHTNDLSVISALPFTLYPKWPLSSHLQQAKLPLVSLGTPGPRAGLGCSE